MKNFIELLELSVPTKQAIGAFVYTISGELTLTDNKSCANTTTTQLCPTNCNKTILKIHSESTLSIVSFDEWVGPTLPNPRCDYIIFDAGLDRRKIAFCELSCSIEKYTNNYKKDGVIHEGKRSKAFKQIAETVNLIFNDVQPVIITQTLTFVEKIGIFGWRDRNTTEDNRKVLMNMRTFTSVPGSQSKVIKYSSSHPNLSAIYQVKYPCEYQW